MSYIQPDFDLNNPSARRIRRVTWGDKIHGAPIIVHQDHQQKWKTWDPSTRCSRCILGDQSVCRLTGHCNEVPSNVITIPMNKGERPLVKGIAVGFDAPIVHQDHCFMCPPPKKPEHVKMPSYPPHCLRAFGTVPKNGLQVRLEGEVMRSVHGFKPTQMTQEKTRFWLPEPDPPQIDYDLPTGEEMCTMYMTEYVNKDIPDKAALLAKLEETARDFGIIPKSNGVQWDTWVYTNQDKLAKSEYDLLVEAGLDKDTWKQKIARLRK